MLQSRKNPNDANLYNVMGRVYEAGLKDYANAEKNFQIALEKIRIWQMRFLTLVVSITIKEWTN